MAQSVNSTNSDDLFSVSLITPWIKGSIKVDNAFIYVDMPNTILFGLLPAGKSKDSSPLSGVTNVYTSKSYKLGSIILGIVLALIGFSMFGSSFAAGLVLLVIGVAVFGGGIKTALTYERSGITKVIEFPFFEAQHVDELEGQIIGKIQAYQDDRNGRMNAERTMHQSQENTQQIVDAVKGSATAKNESVASGKFCPNCGSLLAQGASFCTHCGTKIN